MSKAERVEPKISSIVEVAKTKWLSLSTISYTDSKGKAQKWDMASRTTKRAELEADAVSMLVVVQGRQYPEPHVVLCRQFRPPMQCHTIEMPAGLIDGGETIGQAALRELFEETGYRGKVLQSTKGCPLSPGLSNETASLVIIEVDLELPENINPVQHLEETEDIEVVYIPLASLWDELQTFQAAGDAIFYSLDALALALRAGLVSGLRSGPPANQSKARTRWV